MRKKSSLLLIGLIGLFIYISGCDLYEDEKGDYDNEVTIEVRNLTNCLFDLMIDGTNKGSMNPGDDHTEEDLGRGVHFLEAYPWDDSQFSCASIYTSELSSGDRFTWELTEAEGCSDCEPTPTPEPATPTPTPTP